MISPCNNLVNSSRGTIVQVNHKQSVLNSYKSIEVAYIVRIRDHNATPSQKFELHPTSRNPPATHRAVLRLLVTSLVVGMWNNVAWDTIGRLVGSKTILGSSDVAIECKEGCVPSKEEILHPYKKCDGMRASEGRLDAGRCVESENYRARMC